MGILYDLLPDKDKIDKYIDYYACGEVCQKHADLEYLLRFWEKEKNHYLFKLLNNSFIFEKTIEYEKAADQIEDEITAINHYDKIGPFIRNLRNWSRDQFYEEKFSYLEFDAIRTLTRTSTLARGFYPGGTIKIPVGDKTIAVQYGAKPSKILGKIANAAKIEGYEEFRLEYSRIFNQKLTKGTMCFSIHPLDYMTMSDNSYDWHSCMNWVNEGEFRMGTVEMMNSPMVIVCYLKGSTPFETFDITWSNKKWRNLFIITPDIISGVKGYPYQSEEMDSFCLKTLKELASKNLNWNYGDIIANHFYDAEDSVFANESTEIHLRFSTFNMYNDFGNDSKNHLVLSPNLQDGESLFIHYSGEAECMNCGRVIDSDSDADRLVCNECLHKIYCDNCGCHIRNSEEIFELDDMTLCEDCYNYHSVYDPFDEEYHYDENCERLFLVKNEESLTKPLEDFFTEAAYVWVYNSSYVPYEVKSIYIKRSSLFYSGEWISYILAKDCDEDTLELYHEYGECV